MTRHSKPNAAQIEAAADRIRKKMTYDSRGFSDTTIDALWAAGFALPERLLVTTLSDIVKAVPALGPAELQEIVDYRSKYTPHWR